MYMMQKPKSEIAQVQKEYMERIKERVNEYLEKVKMSAPPESLMKERRSFQREKEHAALRYASVG
jgi:gas vesicle protein